MGPLAGSRVAQGADALTVLRLLAAAVLVGLVWGEAWTATALVLSVAWVSDVLDGRLARASGRSTHMGRWDMHVDTAVGAGVLVGLTGQGAIPPWAGLLALVLFGGLFLAGNLAAAMLLQLTGFLPLFQILWTERPSAWWLPPVTALLIGVADWRRLVTINIPAFIRGAAGRFEHR